MDKKINVKLASIAEGHVLLVVMKSIHLKRNVYDSYTTENFQNQNLPYVLIVATCTDEQQNQGETDVDCGGPCPDCATCYDELLNQGETDIDCGGPCAACPTCNDGIQNQEETGLDCGGPCAACPTCDDGIQNQEETGLDCGGPCPTTCPGMISQI